MSSPPRMSRKDRQPFDDGGCRMEPSRVGWKCRRCRYRLWENRSVVYKSYKGPRCAVSAREKRNLLDLMLTRGFTNKPLVPPPDTSSTVEAPDTSITPELPSTDPRFNLQQLDGKCIPEGPPSSTSNGEEDKLDLYTGDRSTETSPLGDKATFSTATHPTQGPSKATSADESRR